MENERENKLRRWIDVDSKTESGSERKRVTQKREREREKSE